MEEKLKTLKDLEKKLYDNCCADAIDIIKAEAVKWVKSGEYDYPDILIKFCDITEEDLKEVQND